MPMKKILCLVLAAILVLGVMPMEGLSATNADELTISDAGVDFIKSFEGFSAKPQWDYGQWSIGYGSCLVRPPENPTAEQQKEIDALVDYYTKNPIDEKEGTERLAKELQSHVGHVRKFMKKYDLTVTQPQFDSLVSLTYNIGQAWTTKTKYYMPRKERTSRSIRCLSKL